MIGLVDFRKFSNRSPSSSTHLNSGCCVSIVKIAEAYQITYERFKVFSFLQNFKYLKFFLKGSEKEILKDRLSSETSHRLFNHVIFDFLCSNSVPGSQIFATRNCSKFIAIIISYSLKELGIKVFSKSFSDLRLHGHQSVVPNL